MAYQNRVEIYTRIEAVRSRPLITYVTSVRKNATGIIASDVIPEFIKQIQSIPEEKKEIDLLLVSNGGDGIVAARIISLLRERFEKVGVLIPYVAYSAATLIAMGADEIIMHPFSNLGPVDPQLTISRRGPDGNPESFSYGAEDLRNYFAFVKQDVGVSDQEQMSRAFELLCAEVGPIPIGITKRSTFLSSALGEKLLALHMKDSSKAKAITDTLISSYHHHGYPVGRTDAKEVGLPVKVPADNLEDLLWQVWEDFSAEMECHTAFDPLLLLFNSPSGHFLFSPIKQPMMPGGIPPQLLEQLYASLLSQVEFVDIEPVDYELFTASLESTRCRSEYHSKGKITAMRSLNLNITFNLIPFEGGWTFFNK